FKEIGKGTLLPMDPTQKLVVAGPYRHVRNPMYCGVFSILAGEAILFGSLYLLGWFLLFSLIIHFFILFFEEPGLVKRFGEEYIIYRENVPRWIPRRTPWERIKEKDSAN
ncbi:MAG: isoprenylcysteine carboxylmethyltransferase family protein, partial [Thermoactinomyces sp.]